MIINQFHKCFTEYNKALHPNQPVYLYLNEEKSCLQIGYTKESSLCELFQKMQAYLKRDIETPDTHLGLTKKIIQLDDLLKNGKNLITRYDKKSQTWCRRLLKCIHFYVPTILKKYFPSIFNNELLAKP